MFFPQLYTITSYSLLQSTIRIREYVQAVSYTHLDVYKRQIKRIMTPAMNEMIVVKVKSYVPLVNAAPI
ncbi:hypothetical protein A5845_000010 [Enterococcus faecium]|nr:hypothetical protein A5845_000010 [Enterococcus faecium]